MAKVISLDRGVFINCPFDPDYNIQFRAIVFTVLRCGFDPHCALEIVDSSQTRISKIQTIIEQCRLGVHDISRTELNKSGLPRFNMPFELGLFLGAQRYGGAKQKQKRCLILDREQYRYQQFLSDIAGQDVESHRNDLEEIIKKVRDFLDNTTIGDPLPSGEVIQQDFERLLRDLQEICRRLELTETTLSFTNYVWIVVNFLSEKLLS